MNRMTITNLTEDRNDQRCNNKQLDAAVVLDACEFRHGLGRLGAQRAGTNSLRV